MASFEAAALLQGSGAANPVVALFTVPAGETVYITSIALSYGTSAANGASAIIIESVLYGATLGVSGAGLIARLIGLGEKSGSIPISFDPAYPIPPGDVVWLYMSGVPTATDYAYATVTGYTQ